MYIQPCKVYSIVVATYSNRKILLLHFNVHNTQQVHHIDRKTDYQQKAVEQVLCFNCLTIRHVAFRFQSECSYESFLRIVSDSDNFRSRRYNTALRSVV